MGNSQLNTKLYACGVIAWLDNQWKKVSWPWWEVRHEGNSMPLKLSCDRGHVQMKWQPDERGQLNQHTLGCEARGRDLIQWTCPVKTAINCVFQQQKLCSEPIKGRNRQKWSSNHYKWVGGFLFFTFSGVWTAVLPEIVLSLKSNYNWISHTYLMGNGVIKF